MDTDIRTLLFDMADEGYRSFHSALMPTVAKERVIGVRVPSLRRLAKELAGTAAAAEFVAKLPHRYYEEDNLHAFLIERIKDQGECLAAVDRFLPYVDNWATCDMMVPKTLYTDVSVLLGYVAKWLNSGSCYTVRYGIGVLMHLLGGNGFDTAHLQTVADIRSEEYYVNMMRAWYFATALAFRYKETLPYIKERRLDKWTHAKAIQKAVESKRIPKDVKELLKRYK